MSPTKTQSEINAAAEAYVASKRPKQQTGKPDGSEAEGPAPLSLDQCMTRMQQFNWGGFINVRKWAVENGSRESGKRIVAECDGPNTQTLLPAYLAAFGFVPKDKVGRFGEIEKKGSTTVIIPETALNRNSRHLTP